MIGGAKGTTVGKTGTEEDGFKERVDFGCVDWDELETGCVIMIDMGEVEGAAKDDADGLSSVISVMRRT